jgi:hypothetical protein
MGSLSLIPEGECVEIASGVCPIAGMIKVEWRGIAYGVFAVDYRAATSRESEILTCAS